MAGLPGGLDLAQELGDLMIQVELRLNVDYLGALSALDRIDFRARQAFEKGLEYLQGLFLNFQWIERFHQTLKHCKQSCSDHASN